MTAALIDHLLCPRCGTSLVDDVRGVAWERVVTPQSCPCRPDNPALLASFVALRHADAVRLAEHRARPRKAHPYRTPASSPARPRTGR